MEKSIMIILLKISYVFNGQNGGGAMPLNQKSIQLLLSIASHTLFYAGVKAVAYTSWNPTAGLHYHNQANMLHCLSFYSKDF